MSHFGPELTTPTGPNWDINTDVNTDTGVNADINTDVNANTGVNADTDTDTDTGVNTDSPPARRGGRRGGCCGPGYSQR